MQGTAIHRHSPEIIHGMPTRHQTSAKCKSSTYSGDNNKIRRTKNSTDWNRRTTYSSCIITNFCSTWWHSSHQPLSCTRKISWATCWSIARQNHDNPQWWVLTERSISENVMWSVFSTRTARCYGRKHRNLR